MVKKSELQLKDVIDGNRGKKLGYIDDVEINTDKGNIKAIIVPPAQYKILSFFTKRQDFIIEWKDIQKIGEDVILVNV